MEKRLNKYIKNIKNFNKLLQETKSVIAGSFPLQVIMETEWKESDIDIWVPSFSAFSKIADLLCNNEEYQKVNTAAPTRKEEYLRLSTYIAEIYYFKNDNITMNIIIVTSHKTIDEVVRSFDLTVCQILYDGKECKILDNYIEDIQQKTLRVSQKAIEEQSPFEWIRTIDRIKKYKQRGFKRIEVDWKHICQTHIFPTFQKWKDEAITKDNINMYQNDILHFYEAWNNHTLDCSLYRYWHDDKFNIPNLPEIIMFKT